MVLRLDSASRGVARRLCVVCSLNHPFFLLSFLGRTALRVALACRALAARIDHRSGARRVDYARCSTARRCSGGLRPSTLIRTTLGERRYSVGKVSWLRRFERFPFGIARM